MTTPLKEKNDVTEAVKSFYNETPFPNYDDIDTLDTLIKKSNQGQFAKLLDEQIPLNAKIIECGSGTAQLSNFLSIKQRDVIAADLSINALQLGKSFADQNKLASVKFININLFSLPFTDASFDLVISNGVLHHTENTQAAFQSIARLVKPGGYIIIGLYHRWGRLITDFRRVLFKLLGEKVRFLDPNLRSFSSINSEPMTKKQQSWFNDQYCHPQERKHTIKEVANWYSEAGFDVVCSVPNTHLFKPFTSSECLFVRQPLANSMEMRLKEMSLFFKGSKEGGFFTLIGRKR